ncbi:MAG: NAD(P)-dependent oxidoreductase [Chloroflexi bacterium]|nr:NAD(P)-dependent oxidoreductase [Chloroflexota bacterium]
MLVLVTGAAGRIGAHLVRALVRRGHRVRAFVLPNDPRAPLIAGPGVDFSDGRLEDRAAVERAVTGVDAVYHLGAALTSRGNTDEEFFEFNLRGTFNLLMAVRERAPGCQSFAYASSDAVYWSGGRGPARYLPVDESHPRMPGTVYGASKLGAEELCLTFWRGFGIPVTILRFTATADVNEILDPNGTFGPLLYLRAAIRALTPETSAGVVRLVPASATPSAEQLESLRILKALDDGTDKLLVQQDVDGRPTIHQRTDARDVGEGIVPVLDRPEAVGEAFNIGGPAPFSSEEFVSYVAERTGLPIVRARLPTARAPWYVSSAKARGLLGYEPKRTIFDMLDEALTLASATEDGPRA